MDLHGLRDAGLIPPTVFFENGVRGYTARETREMMIRLSFSCTIDRILRIRGRLAIFPRSPDPLNTAVSLLLVDAAARGFRRDFCLANRGVDRR